MFRSTYVYQPYFLVDFEQTYDEEEVCIALSRQCPNATATAIKKLDLEMENHLDGVMRKLVKLTFDTVEELQRARRTIEDIIKAKYIIMRTTFLIQICMN